MKWYLFYTPSKATKESLTEYLKDNNIYYECSGDFMGYHLSIRLNDNQAIEVNKQLDYIYAMS